MSERNLFALILAGIISSALIITISTVLYWKYQFELKADGVVSVYEQAKTVYYRVDGKQTERISEK